jgi:hypothetical protein
LIIFSEKYINITQKNFDYSAFYFISEDANSNIEIVSSPPDSELGLGDCYTATGTAYLEGNIPVSISVRACSAFGPTAARAIAESYLAGKIKQIEQ